MSARAAVRLRSLGYESAYDYVGGNADWLASGGLFEGAAADPSFVGTHVDRDVPTVGPNAPKAHVARLLKSSRLVLVATSEGVVLGRIEPRHIEGGPVGSRAEDLMGSGPTTVRADENVADLNARMDRKSVDNIVVSRPDGVLIGVYFRGAVTRPVQL